MLAVLCPEHAAHSLPAVSLLPQTTHVVATALATETASVRRTRTIERAWPMLLCPARFAHARVLSLPVAVVRVQSRREPRDRSACAHRDGRTAIAPWRVSGHTAQLAGVLLASLCCVQTAHCPAVRSLCMPRSRSSRRLRSLLLGHFVLARSVRDRL